MNMLLFRFRLITFWALFYSHVLALSFILGVLSSNLLCLRVLSPVWGIFTVTFSAASFHPSVISLDATASTASSYQVVIGKTQSVIKPWNNGLFCSCGSGVLAEHEEDRCSVHGAGDWSSQPVPAQCHHCAFPHLSRCHVYHLPYLSLL